MNTQLLKISGIALTTTVITHHTGVTLIMETLSEPHSLHTWGPSFQVSAVEGLLDLDVEQIHSDQDQHWSYYWVLLDQGLGCGD